jgi:hypothetical protein
MCRSQGAIGLQACCRFSAVKVLTRINPITREYSSLSTWLPVLTSIIVSLVTFLGGHIVATHQSRASFTQKIIDVRSDSYEKAMGSLLTSEDADIVKLLGLILRTRNAGTDGDVFILDTDISEFYEQQDPQQLRKKLVKYFSPLLVRGSETVASYVQTILSIPLTEIDNESLNRLPMAYVNRYRRNTDPSTPCYGCNHDIPLEQRAKIILLSELIEGLLTQMRLELNGN